MASTFKKRLREISEPTKDDFQGRRWVLVPYDQLTDAFGPLREQAPEETGIILIENRWKPRRRPYCKAKLAFILSNMRHFALEQAEKGTAVHYVFGDDLYRNIIDNECTDIEEITVMRPAERELRVDLQPLVDDGKLTIVPHKGWITTSEEFKDWAGDAPWKMDSFYRKVRKENGILLGDDGGYEGGKVSFDDENRESWDGSPEAPELPQFEMTEVMEEVFAFVNDEFKDHPGELHEGTIPGTAEHAKSMWQWAKKNCMELFGPYEDAMSTQSRTLFHTRISALLNIHRLRPAQLVRDVEEMNIPLNSKEGFIRQVAGWREFMFHVHDQTDGFREIPFWDAQPETMEKPGDAGYRDWKGSGKPTLKYTDGPDGGACPNMLEAEKRLPEAYWGTASGLTCLDTVVKSVVEEGYSHHITRLMILSNIGTLLDVSPRDLTDWFWVMYTDAYDWVVEPNVLGMGTFGLGDLFVTKPYVSGANYINKMSDYCQSCAFNPKTNCPITPMYWAFLGRHQEKLSNNPRMSLILASLRKRKDEKKETDRNVFEMVSAKLEQGEKVTPNDMKAIL